jgi:DNA-binding NarL/FixJ family response regulator
MGLGARPLVDRCDDLARRARLAVDAGTGVPDARADAVTGEGGGQPRRPRDNGAAPLDLSPRELEVLALMADGRTNREIAEELFISPKTAGIHVSHILDKLGVANRVEAAMAAARLGLVDRAG